MKICENVLLLMHCVARASSSESGTLPSLVINLAGKPFCYDSLQQSTAPSWRGLSDLKAVHSDVLSQTLVRNFSLKLIVGKPTDDSVPDVQRRHQMAHQHICYCVNTYRGTYAQTLMANQWELHFVAMKWMTLLFPMYGKNINWLTPQMKTCRKTHHRWKHVAKHTVDENMSLKMILLQGMAAICAPA